MSTTIPRNTPKRAGASINLALAAAAVLTGTLAAANASGYGLQATDTAGLTVLGIWVQDVDNSAGNAGDLNATLERGVFRLENSIAHPVTIASIGHPCYVEDNETVASSSANSIIAGIVVAVDGDGVWVDTTLTTPQAGTVADAAISAAKLANAVADAIPTISVAVANTGTPNGVANVTIQAKDIQGNNLAARVLLRVWLAATAYAAPADLGTLTASTGILLKEDTDDALATVITDAAGLAVLALDTAADGAVHVMAAPVGICGTASAAITGN